MRLGNPVAIFALCFFSWAAGGPRAFAHLDGDTITATDHVGFLLSPGSATIGAGVEFQALQSLGNPLGFDFAEGTLTVTSQRLLGGDNYPDFTFSGFDDVIVGFSLLSNSGWSGTPVTNYSFTDHSVTLNMGDWTAQSGAVMVFKIDSTPAPVPDSGSTLSLLGSAVVGLAALRRKPAEI